MQTDYKQNASESSILRAWSDSCGTLILRLRGIRALGDTNDRLYNRLHDVEATVASQISSEVIKLLNAHALHFTMEAMHRVIDMREQERESKRHTKGWRLGKYDVSGQLLVCESTTTYLRVTACLASPCRTSTFAAGL